MPRLTEKQKEERQIEGSRLLPGIHRRGGADQLLQLPAPVLQGLHQQEPGMDHGRNLRRQSHHGHQSRREAGLHEDDQRLPQRRDRHDRHQIHLKVRKEHRQHPPLRQDAQGKGQGRVLRGRAHQHTFHGWRIDAHGPLIRRLAGSAQHLRARQERAQDEDGKRGARRIPGMPGVRLRPEDEIHLRQRGGGRDHPLHLQ